MIIVLWYLTMFILTLYIAGYFDSREDIYKPSDVYIKQANKAMDEARRQYLAAGMV